MHRALSAQWAAQKARLAVAEGKDPGPVGEGGREYDDDALAEYEGAKTELDYANWLRSKEIADFFSGTRSFHPAGQQKPARTRGGESGSFSVPELCLAGCPARGDRTALEACWQTGATCFPHMVLML